jgi:Uma2 family endonuclease
MTNVPIVQAKMNAEEYRQLPEGEEWLQLIDGELIMSASPIDMHQLVGGNTYLYLGNRVGTKRLRYEADLYLSDKDVPRPDIFWISPENQHCLLKEGYWYGAPDLIVEILSPSTAKLDRGKKYQTYERHGVGEYWILDPIDRSHEVYYLKDGKYVRLGFYEPGDKFQSMVLKFEIEVAVLFDGIES